MICGLDSVYIIQNINLIIIRFKWHHLATHLEQNFELLYPEKGHLNTYIINKHLNACVVKDQKESFHSTD